MAELEHKLKDEPCQRVTHASYERWRKVAMALHFEMRQLPWFKNRNGRRPRKTLANPEPFTRYHE